MPSFTDYTSALPRGLYRHYKGNDYRVHATVTHSETEEILVLYAPVTADQAADKARLWVRPLSMFSESVHTEAGTVPRFRLIKAD